MIPRDFRKTIECLACCAAVFLYLSGLSDIAAANEMLVNGGGESGDLSGWSASGPQAKVVSFQEEQAGTVLPFAGSFFFTSAALPGSQVVISQSGAGFLQSGHLLVLSGQVQTENLAGDDYGIATIRVYDASDQLLATVSSAPLATSNQVWEPFQVELLIPDHSGRWEIELEGTLVFGSYVNVFWDELSLVMDAVSGVETPVPGVADFRLVQNSPNPFNPLTTIRFYVPDSIPYSLVVYDLQGRCVRVLREGYGNGTAGQIEVWDGRDTSGSRVASGVYSCRLVAGGSIESRRMVMVK